MRKLGHDGARQGRNFLRQAQEGLWHYALPAAADLAGSAEAALWQARHTGLSLAEALRRRPGTALLIAAGACFLLGQALHRQNRHR